MAQRDQASSGRGPLRIRSGLRRHGLVRRPPAIRRLVRAHRLRFTEGNSVSLFLRGRRGLQAMLEAIEAARRRVHLETYILRHDATGQRFLAALTERARAGVEVRVLYDAVGSRGIDESVFRPLREAGGDVVAFNPLRLPYPRFAPRRRDHRKILVVDGAIAFTGGLNIGTEYERGIGGTEAEWRDAHVRIEGPAARDLDAVFLESWFRADGPDLPWDALLDQVAGGQGEVRCAVLADGPAYRRRRMRDFLIAALGSARDEAKLVSPYLAPGRRVLEALSDASQRGVELDLLTAGLTDHPILRRAARAHLPRLLARGVRIYEYETSMMHAKVAVFDDQWAIVGTSNLDRQSFEHSYEVNVIVEGGQVARELGERLDADLERARRLDSAVLEARGVFERLVDWLSALILYFV
jgi:cardiolipin synthase